MHPELRNVHDNMKRLGLGALAHANWHANFYSLENDKWYELSILQAAHAAEILIKARIAEEHPLLIFEQVPRSTQVDTEFLDFTSLTSKAKTIQYADLPERLWATTGIKLPNIELFKAFGAIRNSIQHFATPGDFEISTNELIYEVIDPFINDCWGLYAIDFCEDHEPYIYLIEGLIRGGTEFLVSPESIDNLQYVDFNWPANAYRNKMNKRFKEAGYIGPKL